MTCSRKVSNGDHRKNVISEIGEGIYEAPEKKLEVTGVCQKSAREEQREADERVPWAKEGGGKARDKACKILCHWFSLDSDGYQQDYLQGLFERGMSAEQALPKPALEPNRTLQAIRQELCRY